MRQLSRNLVPLLFSVLESLQLWERSDEGETAPDPSDDKGTAIVLASD